ncbi:hypothetical protein OA93_19290 [Flavobacterium sp. KMS]|uniref:hypothetical protein n=1 Tax=Flavobacterium sp. KMS TaxID=1566023 RepID=UPI00057CEA77|nr:hypothetical protein [Flavobacterium sp. KMS]KIA94851.1 hypothetical protein OA93_19290 [Flavobacterium sp. KMS]
MKKIILLFSLMLIITSCSSNDEDTYGIFNPPNWIQGTWKEETSGAILTFTARDIKYTTTGDSFSFSKQTSSLIHYHKKYLLAQIYMYLIFLKVKKVL